MRESFGHAFDGIGHLLRTQRSFRIHVAVAAAVLVAAAVIQFSPGEWALLVLTITIVVALEGVNTGVEITVTLASPERRLEAKAAKDVAAGMVLLGAMAAVVVGMLLFGPHLLPK